MSGDWIKMRIDLSTDPAVVMIALRTELSEDEVVGKLHKVWGWVSRNSRDGSATVTTAWIDKYVARDGFARAMCDADWLEITDSGVMFPNFDRHNSLSAKVRAENTRRQNVSRTKRDKSATREEKRRISSSSGGRAKRREISTTEMQAVADAWNMLGAPFKAIRQVHGERRKHLTARLADDEWRGTWQEAMRRMASSKFCRGAGDKAWVAGFDWFIRPKSVNSILEGKYDDRTATGAPGGSNRETAAEARQRGNLKAIDGFLQSARVRESDAGADGREANGAVHDGRVASLACDSGDVPF